MTNLERLSTIRERLTPCQIALAELQRYLAEGSFSKATVFALELGEAFLDLESATGAVCTPASLFE